ncbi:MAG: hypothetical protein ACOCW2_02255 [Chitinivibrionales bacterium]
MSPNLSTSLRYVKAYARSMCLFAFSAISFLVLNGSTCATVDPLPPDRFEAPFFTTSDVRSLPVDGELREIIHLQWQQPLTANNSVIEYRMIRRMEYDSFSSIISIPSGSAELFDPVDELSMGRLQTRSVLYQVFSIDSMERAGDTSALCTVSLAPLVSLHSPADTLFENRFTWSVYNVANPCMSHIYVFKDNRILWQSEAVDGIILIGNDNEKQLDVSLPDSIYNDLSGNGFAWAVKLQVLGAGDPVSVTSKPFFAGPSK